MRISASAAGLVAAACLAGLVAGCGGNGGAPEAGPSHAPATSTAAPSAPASTPPVTTAPVTTVPATTVPATTVPATTAPGSPAAVPRCHTSQLTAAYTGLNAAMGGSRGMTLILTNHSGRTCYLYGYPGLAFTTAPPPSTGPVVTHLTWMKAPHAKVIMHPGSTARAMLTWRVNVGSDTPFKPGLTHITPPDEHAYLVTLWQGGPVLDGNIASWPLEAAPAGPFPAGTGTISGPFKSSGQAAATSATPGTSPTTSTWPADLGP